jgi:hypothetical protein
VLKPFPHCAGLDALSPVKRCQPCPQFLIEDGDLRTPRPVVLFEEPQGLADYLAGGIVATGFHFAGNEFVQFGGQRDIHGRKLLILMVDWITRFVNLCYSAPTQSRVY